MQQNLKKDNFFNVEFKNGCFSSSAYLIWPMDISQLANLEDIPIRRVTYPAQIWNAVESFAEHKMCKMEPFGHRHRQPIPFHWIQRFDFVTCRCACYRWYFLQLAIVLSAMKLCGYS